MKHLLFLIIVITLSACKEALESSLPPNIESVAFLETAVNDVQMGRNSISISLPYETNIKRLTPTFLLQNTIEIIPKSGIPQDFSKPVLYTLVGNKGQKVVFTIKVNLQDQPPPQIFFSEKDTVEAGYSTMINGKFFGRLASSVNVFLVNPQDKEIQIPFKHIDFSKIEVTIPIETKVGSYKIKVKVNSLEAISNKSVIVSYPSPQVLSLSHKNILNSDTLWITAKFIDSIYSFSGVFKTQNSYFFQTTSIFKTNKIGVIPKGLIGQYEVFLKNSSEQKISKEDNFTINILDHNLPFVISIISPKEIYKSGEEIVFETLNFDKSQARFYQVVLKSTQKTYIKNGLFSNQKLAITLPENIEKGEYRIGFVLFDPQKIYNYSFETDLVIKI